MPRPASVKLKNITDNIQKNDEKRVKSEEIIVTKQGSFEIEFKNALLQVLSNSMIMKSMISSIKNINFNNNKMIVELSSAHTSEYLTNNSKDISNEINSITKKNIDILFVHNSIAVAAVSQKPGYLEDTILRQDTKSKENINKDNNYKNNSSKKEDDTLPDLVNNISDLFNGKIEK